MSFASFQSESDVSAEQGAMLDADAYNDEGNRRLRKHNDVSGALLAYTRAISLSRSNYTHFNNRALAFLRLGNLERAIEDCDSSLDLCKNVKAYCRKACALGKLGQFDVAVTTVLKALDMDPDDKEASQVLETLLKDKNTRAGAHEESNTPEGIANKQLNEKLIQKRACDLVAEGKLCIKNNNFKDGIDNFTKAITLCPNSYKYYYYRAFAHKINGDYKKSLIDAESSWQINHNIESYQLKSSILSKQKRFQEAIACIMLCLDIDPDNETSIQLHAEISKAQLGRNRAPTLTLPSKTAKKSNKKDKFLHRLNQSKDDLVKSPSKLMSKLSSPRSEEEDVPWYNVPTRHTRSSETVKRGAVRIVDKFEWQELPAEYAQVGAKNTEGRSARTVHMKHISRKAERPSPLAQFFSDAYIVCVGTLQRVLSTERSRKAAVKPEMVRRRRSRNMIQVGV